MLLLISLQVVTSIPSEKFPYFENVTEGHQVFMNSYLKKPNLWGWLCSFCVYQKRSFERACFRKRSLSTQFAWIHQLVTPILSHHMHFECCPKNDNDVTQVKVIAFTELESAKKNLIAKNLKKKIVSCFLREQEKLAVLHKSFYLLRRLKSC